MRDVLGAGRGRQLPICTNLLPNLTVPQLNCLFVWLRQSSCSFYVSSFSEYVLCPWYMTLASSRMSLGLT